jgi:hypothetical protein
MATTTTRAKSTSPSLALSSFLPSPEVIEAREALGSIVLQGAPPPFRLREESAWRQEPLAKMMVRGRRRNDDGSCHK